jgi:hypothetical protein
VAVAAAAAVAGQQCLHGSLINDSYTVQVVKQDRGLAAIHGCGAATAAAAAVVVGQQRLHSSLVDDSWNVLVSAKRKLCSRC